MQLDGDFLLVCDKETVIHSLTANIGQFGSNVTALYISFLRGECFHVG
jgi:hypothetical protein